jgi:hypothetical protein
MRTLVVSDLHLGDRHGGDVLLREPAAREALVAALAEADRLVLLGDVVELRHGPQRAALAAAAPVLAELGAAMAGRPVVLVPGNHDHALAARWHEEAPALGLDERRSPAEASPAAAELAAALAPAQVEVAYPGLWLRDDVYATHGHYLDVHSTTPTVERLGAGLMARLAGAPPRHGAQPAHYEAILAPLYAWIHAAAQRPSPTGRGAGAGASGRFYDTLTATGRRPLRARALAAGFPLAVGALNRAGLGPLHRDISGPGLRRGGLRGMRETLRRLDVGAGHVVFGHTHRAGPLAGDDPAEWAGLVNAGCWVRDPSFATAPGRPYWPGTVVEVGDDGPPVVRFLL